MAEPTIQEILSAYEAESPGTQEVFDGAWEALLDSLRDVRAASFMRTDDGCEDLEHFFWARIRAMEAETAWLRKENAWLRLQLGQQPEDLPERWGWGRLCS